MGDVIAALVRIADYEDRIGRHDDAAQTRANAYRLAYYTMIKG